MTAGAGAIGVGETMFGPEALPPPPTRYALFFIVLGLSALVQFGAISWGELWPTPEGQYAGTAREMWRHHSLLVPTAMGFPLLQEPPLFYWALIASFKLLGVNIAAARLPGAIANVITTALIFGIGERMANYWRGFSAALVFLSSAGVIFLGRLVTPGPLTAMFATFAIYGALRGYQQRQPRWWWFAGTWLAAALACLSGGWNSGLALALTCAALAVFHREARLRFRALLWWPYLLLFCVLISPRIAAFSQSSTAIVTLNRGTFPQAYFAALFPWLSAILPALLMDWRKVIRPGSDEFKDDLPWIWAALTLLCAGLAHAGAPSTFFLALPAVALWSAMVWERTSDRLRTAGAMTTLLAAAVVVPFVVRTIHSLFPLPAPVWNSFQPLFALVGVSIALGVAITIWLIRRQESMALVGLTAGMIPVSFALAMGMARVSPLVSFHETANFLRAHLGKNGDVLFEGPIILTPSLNFYLERPCSMVNSESATEKSEIGLSEPAALDRFAEARPMYLIIEQNRAEHWHEILTQRFHVYHQVASCDRFLVLANQF